MVQMKRPAGGYARSKIEEEASRRAVRRERGRRFRSGRGGRRVIGGQLEATSGGKESNRSRDKEKRTEQRVGLGHLLWASVTQLVASGRRCWTVALLRSGGLQQ
uniref:Uncharacterized protein n=1 Tax=Opuntia streptacantha TaxID=393608 RepID=A0A7C8YGG5_OPUST